MKTSQARRAMSEVECGTGWGIQGLGSYLLLLVGSGPPAPKRTAPGSIDCSQVLTSALFTIQFNHTLDSSLTSNCHNSHERGPGCKAALINVFISTLN